MCKKTLGPENTNLHLVFQKIRTRVNVTFVSGDSRCKKLGLEHSYSGPNCGKVVEEALGPSWKRVGERIREEHS